MSHFEPNIPRWSTLTRLLPRCAPARLLHAQRRLRIRLGLERLEDRSVPSGFNLAVTSLADNGPGTLRSAITMSDARSATHRYTIVFKVTGAIPLESALPDLSKSVTVTGPGARRLTVLRDPNASSDFGIFVVDSGVAAKIAGMTIAKGQTTDYGSGGGINNSGTLTLSRTTITGNAAYDGGGIDNSGTLNLSDSSVVNNQAIYSGSGIDNTGTLTVSHTTISGNSGYRTPRVSGRSYLAPQGGGIFNGNTGRLTVSYATISSNDAFYGEGIDNNGSLAISHSNISRNTSAGFGGGIDNNGTLTVSHSTISRNQAEDFGGGIDNTGVLSVSQSTISRNQAGGDIVGPSPYPSGGGIYNDKTGVLTVSHTTLSGNSAYDGEGIYNRGTLTVSNSTISDSAVGAGESGGGIYNDKTGALTVSNTTFSRNSATTGGGIDNNGTLTVSHSNISRNSAVIGGGLYNSGGGQAEIDYSTLNDAGGGGLVNNATGVGYTGSTVHVKKTVVDGVLYNDKSYS
jgi:Right handed beta helix region